MDQAEQILRCSSDFLEVSQEVKVAPSFSAWPLCRATMLFYLTQTMESLKLENLTIFHPPNIIHYIL